MPVKSGKLRPATSSCEQRARAKEVRSKAFLRPLVRIKCPVKQRGAVGVYVAAAHHGDVQPMAIARCGAHYCLPGRIRKPNLHAVGSRIPPKELIEIAELV